MLFGVTGDLAYKKIFPALHAMAKRGHLDLPVIGVARPGSTLPEPAMLANITSGHRGSSLDRSFAEVHVLAILQAILATALGSAPGPR